VFEIVPDFLSLKETEETLKSVSGIYSQPCNKFCISKSVTLVLSAGSP
jgi:hypothetical protein